MSALRIYVPGDAAAVACGADEIANAIAASATKRKVPVEIVRNGSRGMHWLEPMLEVATDQGRIAYGPVEPGDVDSVLDAMLVISWYSLALPVDAVQPKVTWYGKPVVGLNHVPGMPSAAVLRFGKAPVKDCCVPPTGV